MKQFLRHFSPRPTVFGIVLLTLDGLFFGLTNPNSIPSALLIVGFILLALSLYSLLRLCFFVLAFYRLTGGRKGRRLALLLSISVSIAIALQSLGELTLRDAIVLTLLSTIAYAYLSYGRAKRP